MKNELKISTLSIVCVLCAAVAMPAFGASSVRSLGGAGTYASASSAAAAKSNQTSGATNSVRGGSMRVNSSASSAKNATRSSSTRTATTPRLSIGKYLAGSSAISGGSSNRVEIDKIQGDLAATSGVLQSRIVNLEKALGLFTEDGLSGDLVVDVEALQDDLNDLTTGMDAYSVAADYTNDVLTIKQGDTVVLSETFATADGLTEIQEKLDELTDALAAKASQSDVDALEAALATLEQTVENLDSVSATDYATQVQALKDADAALQSAINELNAIDHSAYATTEYVGGLLEGFAKIDDELKAADTEIDKRIAALETGSSESAIDLTDIKTKLATAMESLSGLATRITTAEQAILANADDVEALELAKADKTALDALQKTLQDAINAKQDAGSYADASELAALANRVNDLVGGDATTTSIAELQREINEIVANYATKADLTSVEEELLNKIAAIDLSPYAKTANLAAVATSGSYNDLNDKPDLTQYVTQADTTQLITNALNTYDVPDGSITAAKLAQGAVTADKIDTEMAAGSFVMLMSNGDGTSTWVDVTVDAE